MPMQLLTDTPSGWLAVVLADFDAFLLDHAANERKASATALTFVVRYPDRKEILEPMIQLAREELTHFHRVYRLIAARGLTFTKDTKDPYMGGLWKKIGKSGDTEFLDRLLVAGIVEARGCQRFGLLADALTDPELQAFYHELTVSESRHADLFIELAHATHQDSVLIDSRLQQLLEIEAQVVENLELRPALH